MGKSRSRRCAGGAPAFSTSQVPPLSLPFHLGTVRRTRLVQIMIIYLACLDRPVGAGIKRLAGVSPATRQRYSRLVGDRRRAGVGRIRLRGRGALGQPALAPV